jgi:protein ImuB
VQSTWRVACVRIPRFPIGAVWRRGTGADSGLVPASPAPDHEESRNAARPNGRPSRSPANGDAPNRPSSATPSSSPARTAGADAGAHWDTLPIALADGQHLRAVTMAAARFQIRAGMTASEARARCAALEVLAWDDRVIDDEVRRVTAALLAASPQVTPVAGAPGLWWIGASGLEASGGEPALARALLRLARRWHAGARVAIADSCVAARAGTWDTRKVESHSIIIPPGGCATYLASVPLGLLPLEEELRETLAALGVRRAGAFAAFTAEDVERRWGATGLTAWRLARGEDRRRPGLTRADLPRSASAELVPPVATMEPVLFLVRAALERLVRELIADGRAAATIAITLTLDDARGPLPDARPHTVTREVRLARPLARVAPLLERCRALLDRWPLSAPACGVAVAIAATAPLTGEQGDLLDPGWRDPAAADAAFARLRAELGSLAVVIPVARDEHRPEHAGAWVAVDEDEQAMGHERHVTGHRPQTPGNGSGSPAVSRDSPHPAMHDSSETRVAPALRQLESPEPVDVECRDDGAPRVLWWRGRRVRVARALGPERLGGDWWKDEYARDYWQCEEAEGESDLVLFHDFASTGGWYVQGWYD